MSTRIDVPQVFHQGIETLAVSRALRELRKPFAECVIHYFRVLWELFGLEFSRFFQKELANDKMTERWGRDRKASFDSGRGLGL
jgi:hypothetical protein